ncbi:MAG: hypothetical protein ACOYU4_00565 [Thermodesulfobacteriota bacterium]
MKYSKYYNVANTVEAPGYDYGYEQKSEHEKDATTKEIPQSIDALITPFKAKRASGLVKKEEWTVIITLDSVQFSSPSNDKHISVLKGEAKDRIAFPREYTFIPSGTVYVEQDGKTHEFVLDRAGRTSLRAWLPQKTDVELKNELRKWGIGLIVVGIAHLMLTGFLDPIWGVLIACVGVLNLLIPRRGMFIVNGIVILLAGAMNVSAGAGWKMFGMLQIVWGVKEIRKFKEYD